VLKNTEFETMHASRSILALLAIGVLLTGCDLFVSTQTRLERAQKQLDQGNYRAAMSDVKTALQSEPDNAKARLLLAELSLQIGDRESANKELERALAAGATAEEASAVRYELLLGGGDTDQLAALLEKDTFTPLARKQLLTAKVQSAAGKADEAERTLKSALAKAPGDADIQLDLAKLAAARGDMQQAMELPERIAESGAAHSRALLLRGSIKMAQGQFVEGREDLVKAQEGGGRNELRIPEKLNLATYLTEANLALQDIDGATKSLALLDQWAGQSATTRYLHARIALLNNDPAAAITECQKALRADPDHPQAQLLLAAAHLGQGSLEQAEEALGRLLAAQDNIAARKLLAQVYLARGQPERAQETLRSASGAEADPQVDWLMGAALMQSGSSQDALEHLERSVTGLPDSAERRIDLAAAYISARMPEKAVETLNAIPANSPVAPRAKTLLVLATATGKSAVEARREIDALVAKNPNDAALLAAGGSYFAAGNDVEKARGMLTRSVELEPKAVSSRLALTRLLVQMNHVPAAESQLKEVLMIDPPNQAARLALSELAWGRGDKDQSRKWLEEAISVEPSAVDARLRLAQIAFVEGNATRGRDLLKQATMVGGDRKSALNGAAKVLARAGLTDEAFVKFQEAAAAGLAEAELNAARLQLDLNKPDQARKVLESALARRPDWREAEQLLIRVEAGTGRVDRALALARTGAAGKPPGAAKEAEGDIYALAKKPTQAITAYEEAQRQTPSGALAVKLYTARRDAGVASPEASLTQWLQRSPNDVQVRRALVLVYQAKGERAQAMEQFERLMELGAGDPVTLNNFAWLLYEKGDARAVDLAQRAYTAAPGIAEVADTYGWILVEKGKTAEGMKVLQEALAKAPTNPDVQYHLAAAYAKTGERTKASELVRESLKAKGAFASRSAAEGLLRSLTASTTGSP
jgi:putative PEP-CTERM system TPR-repeat lipoprotein